jgi:hypothetical protein
VVCGRLGSVLLTEDDGNVDEEEDEIDEVAFAVEDRHCESPIELQVHLILRVHDLACMSEIELNVAEESRACVERGSTRRSTARLGT